MALVSGTAGSGRRADESLPDSKRPQLVLPRLGSAAPGDAGRAGYQFGYQSERNSAQLSATEASQHGRLERPRPPLIELWSRRSGVRVPSLTLL